ncbi:MAG: NAD(P)-binding domain-containing protein [Micromonosporaceae bacterium]
MVISSEKVCIIGAGSSGIAACRALKARGIGYDCFEAGSAIGGNWRYQNDNGMSSAYRSLHINTSRDLMAYASYPMPAELPDFPNHFQIAQYFDDFVDHFGLRETITFRTEVVSVAPASGTNGAAANADSAAGAWDVTTRHRDTGEVATNRYSAVLIANGHHWNPRWPEPAFPGADTFTGEQVHAHYYKTPESYAGKRVLVLGIGNSACDIAVETSYVSERTFLAMRRGAYVVPKYQFGKPFDSLVKTPLGKMPFPVQRLLTGLALRIVQGKVTDYGLPQPDHRPLEAHPTVSADLLNRLGHGEITVKPCIDRLDGDTVHFTDGSTERIDIVVYCTGYKISFPFLADGLVAATDNKVDLYRRVVDPAHPGLYFVGLVQPIGAIMPIAEAQSEWLADLLDGTCALPPEAEMRRSIADYDRVLAKRYVASKRHTIQVDFNSYLAELRRERRAGRRRTAGRP